jgi:hypothetical protein
MSMTTAFEAAWRNTFFRPALLMQVDLTDPSARTLRLASEVLEIEGTRWEPSIIAASRIAAPGSFPTSRRCAVSADVTLSTRPLAFQAPGETIHSLLKTYVWEGVAVRLWLWEQSLSAFADALQVFTGVVQRPQGDAFEVRLALGESRAPWRPYPPEIITAGSYATSPLHVRGQPKPKIYGDHRAPGLTSPWADKWEWNSRWEDSGGARFVLPTLVVDSGSSGNKPRVLIAGHRLYKVPNSEFPP